MLLLSSSDFFLKIHFFKKLILKKKSQQSLFSGTLSECQTVWIQIRTDGLSVLICVQTVCKGYQQATKVVLADRVNFATGRLNIKITLTFLVAIVKFCKLAIVKFCN